MEKNDFQKAVFKYALVVFVIIVTCAYSCIRENKIVQITKQLTELEMSNSIIDTEREALRINLRNLQSDYSGIVICNDSLLSVLDNNNAAFLALNKRHKKEIFDLLNLSIPNDTLYANLQPIYPNFGNDVKKFPFSGSQVRQIYAVAITYPRLQDEYSFQSQVVESYKQLNNGYLKGIDNLNEQVENLNHNINKSDSQITNYVKNEVIMSKQIKNKKFWNTVFKGTSLILGTALILK